MLNRTAAGVSLLDLYTKADGLSTDATQVDQAWKETEASVNAVHSLAERYRHLAYALEPAPAEAHRALTEEFAVAMARLYKSFQTTSQLVTREREHHADFFVANIALLAQRAPGTSILPRNAPVPVDVRNPTMGEQASYVDDNAAYGQILQVSIL